MLGCQPAGLGSRKWPADVYIPINIEDTIGEEEVKNDPSF